MVDWLWSVFFLVDTIVEVSDVKTTYRKSCAPSVLVGSGLTLDPSFKVKCGP